MALTEDERALIHRAFGEGPSVLAEAGMDYPEIQKFMNRPDVQDEFRVLTREFDHQDAMNALVKFSAKKQLVKLKDTAIRVLAQALQGPEYLKIHGAVVTDARGEPVVRNPEPTMGQRQVAMDLLDRLNVISDKQIVSAASVNVNILFKSQDEKKVEIQSDPKHATEEQRSLSREKIRNVIAVITAGMAKAKECEAKVIDEDETKASPKKAKKPTKKPAKKPMGILRMRQSETAHGASTGK